jgi:carbamate kinase
VTPGRDGTGRILIALGGNALTSEGDAGPKAQRQATEHAMKQVADLVAAGNEVAITHGNGPQVGNLLLKNEISRHAVPPVPLDWCVAQTQATIGYLIMTALERELAARRIGRAVAVMLTRVLVDPADPAWERPTKPIGQGKLRRTVPSPEPLRILDQDAVVRLLDDGAIVVAAGGGGIPMVREGNGIRGVEAVIDKDLCGALLADAIGAHQLVIATDVQGVALGFGGGHPEWIDSVSPERLRELIDAGEFGEGSMLPKVEACARFVDAGGERALICHLDELNRALDGSAGTAVTAGGG